MQEQFAIHHGDNREVLKSLPDDSVDSVVTDPPYELGFMGKKWDASGIAYDVELWREVLRVLKPGGHLLAFSGSRTYHRMVVAIEDAGFEIRDQIMWIYGSGFPKSLDISKAIDKAAGVEREVIGLNHNVIRESKKNPNSLLQDYGGFTKANPDITVPATAEAKQWQGWGTALKPAHEPIVVARKPLIGTVADNVLTYGTGGLNIDASRVIAEGENFDNLQGRPITKLATRREGESDDEYRERVLESPGQQAALEKLKELGRWPANVIHDGSDEVVELFPETKAGVAIRSNSGGKNFGSDTKKPPLADIGYGDSGSAARFFYCAKASKRDRNEGLDGFPTQRRAGLVGSDNDKEELDPVSERFRTLPSANHHPTVKPTDLMRYLCRLVTPAGGIVLDPFMGSGSTGKAAIYEGFKFIGIEMTDEYLPIAKARIEFAINNKQEDLFNA